MFFAVGSIYLAICERPGWLAGAAMGLALSIKLAAAIFIPALLAGLSTNRRRAAFVLGASSVFILASLPYLADAPRLILSSMLSYESRFGVWGWPRLLAIGMAAAEWYPDIWPWLTPLPLLIVAYATAGKYMCLAVITLAIARLRKTFDVFNLCSYSVFLFLFLTPGFGIQYLTWAVPFTLAGKKRLTLLFTLVAGALLSATYLSWCGGAPCSFANSLDKKDSAIELIALGLVTWVTIGALLSKNNLAALRKC